MLIKSFFFFYVRKRKLFGKFKNIKRKWCKVLIKYLIYCMKYNSFCNTKVDYSSEWFKVLYIMYIIFARSSASYKFLLIKFGV